ncbi:MAG: hypothetical protein QM765_44440 [Myxococcales bacterium]
MNRKLRMIGTLAALFVLAPQAHASRFANQFIEFELPPQWSCNLEGAEWVCQNGNEAKKREAIIVLAAKLQGPQDTLEQYQAYLDKPKSYQSVQGKPVTSDKRYAKKTSINDQAWVDALHLDSEIPGFYTRYLATVKDGLGVLVTYSIQKDKYTTYLSDFENMVKTLKVFRKGMGINAMPAGNAPLIPTGPASDTIFAPPMAAQPAGGSDKPTKLKKKDDDDDMAMIGLVAVAIIGFIIWKRRRGR